MYVPISTTNTTNALGIIEVLEINFELDLVRNKRSNVKLVGIPCIVRLAICPKEVPLGSINIVWRWVCSGRSSQ